MITAILIFVWLLLGYVGFALMKAYFVRHYKWSQKSDLTPSAWYFELFLSLFGVILLAATVFNLFRFARENGYKNPFKYGMKFTRKYEP